jgi:DNA polymerase III delta prime subunit
MQNWNDFNIKFIDLINTKDPYKKIIENGNTIIKINTLFYGITGFPKKELIKCILDNEFKKEYKQNIKQYCSIQYIESRHYIEIALFKEQNEKHIIELINNIIKTKHINISEKHIIILHNIEFIKNQIPFRILFERYQTNAVFICSTDQISKIEVAIQSRFYGIRIPLFTQNQIKELFKEEYLNILENNRNVYHHLFMMELQKKNKLKNKYIAILNYPPLAFIQIKRTDDILEVTHKIIQKYVEYDNTIENLTNDLLQLLVNDYDKMKIISIAVNYTNNVYCMEALLLQYFYMI